MKNLRITAKLILINFQDLTLKGNFDNYYGRTVFQLLEALTVNQYLEAPRILVPYKFLQNLRGTAYVQLIDF